MSWETGIAVVVTLLFAVWLICAVIDETGDGE